ncbi:MAG TPA: hypothetical protein G4O03_06155 [Dehalococcoidia bacterium]|nr:hypothetical protein [Dehalococcoidia bacterium]
MVDLVERLKTEILVTFSAVGTELQRYGFDLTGSVGGWALKHPDAYQSLVREYAEVGCDILFAAGVQGTRFRLES